MVLYIRGLQSDQSGSETLRRSRWASLILLTWMWTSKSISFCILWNLHHSLVQFRRLVYQLQLLLMLRLDSVHPKRRYIQVISWGSGNKWLLLRFGSYCRDSVPTFHKISSVLHHWGATGLDDVSTYCRETNTTKRFYFFSDKIQLHLGRWRSDWIRGINWTGSFFWLVSIRTTPNMVTTFPDVAYNTEPAWLLFPVHLYSSPNLRWKPGWWE